MMITFRATLVAAGLEPREYEGRGAYGKKCIGVYVDRGHNAGRVFAAVLGAIREMNDQDRYYASGLAIDAFNSMDEDSMGKGTIVYFPTFSWKEG